MALDPSRPETALLLAAMEEVEARTRSRDHAEHDPQPRAVVGAERHASLAVAEMRAATRVDAHRDRTSDVEGKSESVRVDIGGRRIINKITERTVRTMVHNPARIKNIKQ